MTDELHRYWRSAKGRESFEPMLHGAFERLFGNGPQEVSDVPFGEVRAYHEFPEPGLVTFVTFGLSYFILSNSPGDLSGARVEIAWTVADSTKLESAKSVLECFAGQVLASGVVPQMDAISTNCSDAVSACGFTTPALLPLRNQWFDPELSSVENFYPLYFVELLALTRAEAANAEADLDAFYSWAEETGFVATNPLR